MSMVKGKTYYIVYCSLLKSYLGACSAYGDWGDMLHYFGYLLYSLAKVRAVRIADGEIHTYNMLSLLFMVTDYICYQKNFTNVLFLAKCVNCVY